MSHPPGSQHSAEVFGAVGTHPAALGVTAPEPAGAVDAADVVAGAESLLAGSAAAHAVAVVAAQAGSAISTAVVAA